jgi:hypothetical protein
VAGSNPALIVRVAATIEELRRNLAEGVSQIETTTAAMGKLAASFSGDKLIQAAQNVTAAVNSIGGASKLTDAEAARVNATLEKALEKYEALGRVAPPGMRELADETKRVDTESSGLTETVKQLALGFLAMFTARAAFTFVKATLEEASALQDLSRQTRINVEDLQLLAGAMSQFGVDADTLGKGLFKLSRGIAGGDESVATGLHMMGMSLKDLDGINGKELFLKIEGGLATLQGGLRDTAAADLFGGRLGAAMAGASEGIGGAIATWERLNQVASSESVEALETFNEAIKRANKNLDAIAANMIGPVAQGFNVVIAAAEKGAPKWDLFVAMVKDFAASNVVTGASASNLATLLDGLNTKTTEGAAAHQKLAEQARALDAAGGPLKDGMTLQLGLHGQIAAAIDTRTQAEKFMAALEADATVALTAAQRANLAHLAEIGALTASNAAAIGVNGAQFELYKASIDHAKTATEALAKATRDLDTETVTQLKNALKGMAEVEKARLDGAMGNYREQIRAVQDLDIAEQAAFKRTFESLDDEVKRRGVLGESVTAHIKRMDEEAALQTKLAGVTNTAILSEFDAQTKLNASWGLDAYGALKLQKTARDEYLADLATLHQAKVDGVSQSKEEQILLDTYLGKLAAIPPVMDQVKAAGGRVADSLTEMTGTAGAFGMAMIDTSGKSISALAALTDVSKGYTDAVRAEMEMLVSDSVRMEQGMAAQSALFFEQMRNQAASQSNFAIQGGTNAAASQALTQVNADVFGPYGQMPLSMETYNALSAEVQRRMFDLGFGATPVALNMRRDSGGPVSAGQSYYIGTGAQPELFTPSSSGFMTPAGSGGTTVNVTIQVTQPLGTPDAIARAVGEALNARMRSLGDRTPWQS